MNADHLDTLCKTWFADIKKTPTRGVYAAADIQMVSDIVRTVTGLQNRNTGFVLAHAEHPHDPGAFTLKEWTLGDYGGALPVDQVPTVDMQISRVLDARERLSGTAIMLYKLTIKLASKCVVPDRVTAQLKMAHVHMIEDMGLACSANGASYLYLWIRSHNIGITSGYNVTAFFEKTRVVPCVTSDRVSITDGLATIKNMFVGIVSSLKPAPRTHPSHLRQNGGGGDEEEAEDEMIAAPNPKKRKHDSMNGTM